MLHNNTRRELIHLKFGLAAEIYLNFKKTGEREREREINKK
jgi:hypothetical protein